MAIYLPGALVGVPLHKHYCQGHLEDVQVLFEAESCHDHAGEGDSCCSAEMPSCHLAPEADSCKQGSCDSNDCCDDEVEILKADLVLSFPSLPDYSDLNFQVDGFVAPLLIEWESIAVSFYKPLSPIDPGPYLDGHSRLIRHGQFLC